MLFSVITSVYKNDNPEFVRVALDSMLVNQSIKPTEIILVRDGIVSDSLESLLIEYEQKYVDIVHIIRLESNKGHGNASMLGVEAAKFDYVARMDSDDICQPNRFELQLKYFEEHNDVDIVGGQISEFENRPDNIIGYRKVPLENEQIVDFMRNRCALNHVTVMFKRSSVLKAGNYQDWYCNEDYYLWIRMMIIGCRFANIPEILVNVRSGTDQYSRRGGRKYYESEKGIKKLQLKHKMITHTEYVFFVLERYIVQIIMPNWLRGLTIRTLTRNHCF